MQPILQALRVPAFARLAATYTLNELADWIAAIALSVLVYDATHDPLATTALFLANKFAPGLLVPVVAARLDGRSAGRLLASMYTLEAIVLAALALLAGAFWLPAVVALAAVDGLLASAARASTRSATPALLEPRGLLREGNAALNIGFAGMNAAGPIAAGVLIGVFGVGWVIALAAGLFLAQAAVIATAKGIPVTEAPEGSWVGRLREGLGYVRHRPLLRSLLGGQLIVFVLLTMVIPIEVIYAKESLDAGNVGFGALTASWGIGMVLGSAIFARERGRSITFLVVGSTLTMAVGYLGMAAAPGIVVACVASGAGGIGNGVQWVAVVTAIQEATEERFQNRVSGLIESVLTLGPGIGYPLGGAITALLSPRAAFAAAGGGVLVMLLIGGAFMALRRPAAQPQVDAVIEPAAEPAPSVAA